MRRGASLCVCVSSFEKIEDEYSAENLNGLSGSGVQLREFFCRGGETI